MRYIAKTDFDVLDTLFLKGEEIFIGECQYVMNGVIDYGRKIYNSDRKYLGMVRDSYFEKSIRHKVEGT